MSQKTLPAEQLMVGQDRHHFASTCFRILFENVVLMENIEADGEKIDCDELKAYQNVLSVAPGGNLSCPTIVSISHPM